MWVFPSHTTTQNGNSAEHERSRQGIPGLHSKYKIYFPLHAFHLCQNVADKQLFWRSVHISDILMHELDPSTNNKSCGPNFFRKGSVSNLLIIGRQRTARTKENIQHLWETMEESLEMSTRRISTQDSSRGSWPHCETTEAERLSATSWLWLGVCVKCSRKSYNSQFINEWWIPFPSAYLHQ